MDQKTLHRLETPLPSRSEIHVYSDAIGHERDNSPNFNRPPVLKHLVWLGQANGLAVFLASRTLYQGGRI